MASVTRSGTTPKGSGLGTMIVNAMARTVRATVLVDPAHQGLRVVVSLEG